MPPEATRAMSVQPSKSLDHDPISSTASSSSKELSYEDSANCVSRWFLSFLTPILRYGATKALEVEDLGAINAGTEARQSFDTTKAEFSKEGTTLAGAILNAYGAHKFYIAMLYYVIGALLNFVPVMILGDLVSYFETNGEDETFTNIWVECALLGIVPGLAGMLQARNTVIMTHFSVFSRTSVSMLVYEATLSASTFSRTVSSTGEVVNIMSNDTTQIQKFLQFLGLTLVAPVTIIISIYLIYNEIGNAVWVGVAFMIGLGPINGVVFAQVGKMRRLVLKHSDSRVKLIGEILGGIRILKFNAWEKAFQREVEKIRALEMKALTRLAYVIAIGFSLILLSAPIIQPILVFATYVKVESENLTASKAFSVIALFNIMRFPFAFLPMGLVQYAQAKIAADRITRYLRLPKLEKYVDMDEELPKGEIIIDDATFSWSRPEKVEAFRAAEEERKKKMEKKSKKGKKTAKAGVEKNSPDVKDVEASVSGSNPLISRPILQSINLNFKPGSLTAVVGGVGSGKSSLLGAIIGEMELFKGSVRLGTGSVSNQNKKLIAYCPQNPFIINNTLRQNVLFDQGRDKVSGSAESYDKEFYNEVIEASCMSEDLNILPAGDLTEIGERGINLSGGQKSRVALARCMFSKAKIWLMDDPLSAVDAHVGQRLIQSIIDPPREDEKELPTRILVTHHVHVLPLCDNVIVLDEGIVKHFGTYEDLVAQGVDFAGATEFSKDDEDESENVDSSTEDDLKGSGKAKATPKRKEDEVKDSLTTKEERATGSIETKAYLHYAKIGGYGSVFLIVISQAIGRGFEIGSAFWLSYWAEESQDEESSRSPGYYLDIYAIIAMSAVFMTALKSILLAVHRLKASTVLHGDLTNSILSAPVSFFDVTPIGRVLNRFSADMDKIDLELSSSLSQAISTAFTVLGGFAAIIAATKGVFLLPLVPLVFVYWYLQDWFRRSSTELQRVVSITTSPIFVDFSETLNGITSIRAYRLESAFFDTTIRNFNTNNVAYTALQHSNNWLGLRLDILGGLISAFIGGLSVATKDSQFIPAGWLGLALAYSNELSNYMKHGVRMIAQVEAEMSSVERVVYYSTEIEAEAPFHRSTDPTSSATAVKSGQTDSWPSNGEIVMENASMRYRNGPLILKSLDLRIRSGERVGVVGRTGSGKSSLMNALFRIVELADGKIFISGKDIAGLGTHILRSNLAIIPQDPVLFSNTLRYNIDPFGQGDDAEILDILKKVQLDKFFETFEGGLDGIVAEGGENFSQGQRQLICIARALLRKPKILVMDEATASIDNATDALIQDMIRNNFEGATILTIAHRLNTIMDSDRILVLDEGEAVEFDTPAVLLAKEDGLFKALVEKSRKSMKVTSSQNLASLDSN